MNEININKRDLLSSIKNDIIFRCDYIYPILLNAYNRYQSDERDGADYIFDINNQDDLITCVKGGLTARDIFNFYNQRLTNTTTHFLFGYNHIQITPINKNDIIDAIMAIIDDLLNCIIAYPWVEEYRVIYTHYITNNIIED